MFECSGVRVAEVGGGGRRSWGAGQHAEAGRIGGRDGQIAGGAPLDAGDGAGGAAEEPFAGGGPVDGDLSLPRAVIIAGNRTVARFAERDPCFLTEVVPQEPFAGGRPVDG